MFIVDANGVARLIANQHTRKRRCSYVNKDQRRINAESWFEKGIDLFEESNYTAALIFFRRAKRLGHPHAAQAIASCQRRKQP